MTDEDAGAERQIPATGAVFPVSIGAAVGSGLIGGGVILLVEFVTQWLGASTPLGPVHIIPHVLNFEPYGAVHSHPLASLVVHFTVAGLSALVLGWVIHRQDMRMALVVGGLGGALLYGGTFLTLVLSFPGLSAGSYVAMGLLYVAYGILFAWVYKLLQPSP